MGFSFGLIGPGDFEPSATREEEAFSVEQIVAVLKQAELEEPRGGDLQGWDQRADLLSLEEAVCWYGDGPDPADETTPGRRTVD